jgi:hypothetical protein
MPQNQKSPLPYKKDSQPLRADATRQQRDVTGRSKSFCPSRRVSPGESVKLSKTSYAPANIHSFILLLAAATAQPVRPDILEVAAQMDRRCTRLGKLKRCFNGQIRTRYSLRHTYCCLGLLDASRCFGNQFSPRQLTE